MTFNVKDDVNVKKNELEQKLAQLKKMLDSVEGSQTEVYSRIVGYYRSVKNWNAGKRHEYTRRKMYNLNAENTVKAIWSGNASVQTKVDSNSYSKQTELFAMNSDSVKEKDIAKYMLFVKPNCPNCPPVKNYLASSSLEATIIDVSTDEGLELALQYNVQATPTVVFYSKEGKETGRACNKKEAEQYINSLK
ncbi:MAG TPA: anaerobic ribonucleoside-triphosphate reductase [Spirochaetales bacterium]|nr:anaerobic ribonucleoside-triphosphate reductase [Spirochaetales bacterium]HQK34432.1 anaerobic ribonucleoside-triphosphate reductase [Spirochaetales bacterium]